MQDAGSRSVWAMRYVACLVGQPFPSFGARDVGWAAGWLAGWLAAARQASVAGGKKLSRSLNNVVWMMMMMTMTACGNNVMRLLGIPALLELYVSAGM